MSLEEPEDFESAARSFRKKMGVDDQIRPDMKTIVFKLKHHGLIKNYVRVPDADMPNDEAYFDSNKKLLFVRESTFCAASATYSYEELDRRRARFTIAHEIAHIALGHQGVRYRGTTNAVSEEVVKTIRKQEREANRFAAAFLAPAHLAEA